MWSHEPLKLEDSRGVSKRDEAEGGVWEIGSVRRTQFVLVGFEDREEGQESRMRAVSRSLVWPPPLVPVENQQGNSDLRSASP